MYCSKCGRENPDQAAYCVACGAALGQATAALVYTQTSGMAVASLVLGILGLLTNFLTFGLLPIVGLVLGITARRQVRHSQGRLRGHGLATAGIITSSIGLVVIVLMIFFPLYARLRDEAHHTLCVSNLKQVVIALKTYTDDYDQKYPTLHVGSTTDGRWEPRLGVVWPSIIKPYIKDPTVLTCPKADATSETPFSYFFNRRLSEKSADEVAHPSNCIIIGDWVTYRADAKGVKASTTWDIARSKQSVPAGSWEAGNRHNPGTIYGFVDGHAKNLRRTSILAVSADATNPPVEYETSPSFYPVCATPKPGGVPENTMPPAPFPR